MYLSFAVVRVNCGRSGSPFPSRVLCAIAAIIICACSGWVHGEARYPERPVRIVCPASAGSSIDLRARTLAARLSARLGQPFIVENRPGAGTTLGTAIVADARPDGYTLLATTAPAFYFSALLQRNARYDPVASFTAIATFGRGSPFLVVNNALPIRSVADLIALAKAEPGRLRVAHTGAGSANHVPAAMLERAAGIDLLGVPYKSEADSLTDLLGGRVSAAFYFAPLALPLVRDGKVRAVAYAGGTRNPALPGVPTIAEAGYPGFEFGVTMLLLAPARLPPEIVALLGAQVGSIMREPEVRAAFEATGSTPSFSASEATRGAIEHGMRSTTDLIRQFGLMPE